MPGKHIPPLKDRDSGSVPSPTHRPMSSHVFDAVFSLKTHNGMNIRKCTCNTVSSQPLAVMIVQEVVMEITLRNNAKL